MADTAIKTIREAIKEFLEGADLSSASSKKVRAHLNKKFDCDFTSRKKEIDKVVMAVLTELEEANDDHKDSEEDEDEPEDKDDDYSEEEKPKKRASAAKKATPKRKKRKAKNSDSEDDEESEDEGSDEDYKGSSKRGGAKRARATNGSAKKKAGGGGGGKGKTTGYLKKLQLSPELSDVMGEDQMARNEVVKKMYEVVKTRDLLDPKNRQFAILDEQLQKVFGQKRIRMFGMMKLLGKHFSAAE